MITRILAALDGSPRAAHVFAEAADVATRFGAGLHLYRALAVPPEFPPAASTGLKDLLPQHMAEAARDEMRALAARAPSLAIDFRVDAASQPWRAILQVAEEIAADLIIVGSHGYHGWDRVLGTTAAKVANLARCNVLVVHDTAIPADRPSSTGGAVRLL